MDLAACYPATTNLRSLMRTITMHQADGTIRLVDNVNAGKKVIYALPLLAPTEPKPDGTDGWIVENAGQRIRITGSAGLTATLSIA